VGTDLGTNVGTSATEREIADQPAAWRKAIGLAASLTDVLPPAGARIAILGCGTSQYMARAIAAAREEAGLGESDAFAASETRLRRDYDEILAISRSGTTTEVVRALDRLRVAGSRAPVLAVTAVADSPVAEAADRTVVLDFADERSVVQTKFATTALALLRAAIGHDVEAAARGAETALATPPPVDPVAVQHYVFLGRGWTVGLAEEAALKVREAGGAWSEAYPAMEFRHGPMAAVGPGTAVWTFGPMESDLLDDARRTGVKIVEGRLDPMADLLQAQRTAVAIALARGLDPDHPRNLSRSVILS
jgi:fructoselysine-6-P-deglycase FrlB-like protein